MNTIVKPTHSKDRDSTEPDLSAPDAGSNTLSSYFSKLAKRARPKLSKLKNIFKPAALGAIGGAAAKGLTVAAGVATLGPVFALAAGGMFMGFSMFKDFKKREEHESKRDILKKNYKKYLLKTLAVGTGAFVGFVGTDAIIDSLNSVSDIAGTLDGAGAGHVPNEIKTEAIKEIQKVTPPLPAEEEIVKTLPDTDSPVMEIEPEAGNIDMIEAEPEIDPEPVEPEIIIPDDAYARLEMLSQQEGLSERAQSIIDAALKGQQWAIRDAGLGLINGQYGFEQFGEMTGHVDADSWGADLLRDAAEAGDAKAQMDLAYFEYTGINDAIAVNKEAALDVIKAQDDIWLGGDSLLAEVRLDDAKADFLAQMPEGTNIDDYTVRLADDGGYHFEPKEIVMDQEQKNILAQAGIDPDTCELKTHNQQELIWKNCQPMIN